MRVLRAASPTTLFNPIGRPDNGVHLIHRFFGFEELVMKGNVAQVIAVFRTTLRVPLAFVLCIGSPTVALAAAPLGQVSEQHLLTFQGPSLFDDFGRAVDIKDGLAVVGVGAVQSGGGGFSGALVYDAITGQNLHTFVSPPGVTPSSLAGSVAIDQGLVVAGDRFASARGVASSGVAHVFDANTGDLVTSLFDNHPQTNSFFGDLVAVSGRDALVGGWNGKLVYFDAQTGNVQPKLVSPDLRFTLDSVFDVDQRRALITATDTSGHAVGLVIDLPTRELISVLQPLGAGVNSFRRVAIDGDRAILGAPNDDGNNGTAYIFDVSSGTQLHRITSPVLRTGTSTRNAFFGTDVDIDGRLAIVGFPNDSRRRTLCGRCLCIQRKYRPAHRRAGGIRQPSWRLVRNRRQHRRWSCHCRRKPAISPVLHSGGAYIFAVPEPSNLCAILVGLFLTTMRWRARHRELHT